jgi:hypothetical protein
VKEGLGQAAGGEYSKPPGDTSEGEYIEEVNLKDLRNKSGDNGGYADFTDLAAEVGTLEDVELQVEISTGGRTNYVRAWIDTDKDFQFSDENTINVGSCADAGAEDSSETCTVSTTFEVPAGLLEVPYRIRITSSRTDFQDPPTENTDYFGETEDYTLKIVDGEGFPPDTLGIKITSVDSPVGYGQTSFVTVVVKNTKDFSESGTAYLDVQERDGSYTNVDLTGINGLASGESVTKTLQWDTSVGFPEPEGGNEEWNIRARTEADGTSGTEDKDKDVIRVTDALIIEGTAYDDESGEASKTKLASSSETSDASSVQFSYFFNPSVNRQDSTSSIGLSDSGGDQFSDGNVIWSVSYPQDRTESDYEEVVTVDISNFDSDLYLAVDDGYGSVQEPDT